MPRPPRLDLPGARHHVMNRGARRAPIFRSDEDCVRFLGLLGDLPRLFGAEVHGYALMPNHFHLMLVCPRGGLGRAMQHLQSRFTADLNARNSWDGPVFRGRYRNRLVDDERYWAHLLSYLHLNPVKARLAPSPAEARWTSCRAYYGLDACPDWLKTEDLLDAFLGPKGLAAYTEEHQIGRAPGPDGFDEEDLWTRPRSAALPPPSPPPPPRWPLSPELAWEALVSVTTVSKADILVSPTGRRGGNPARDVAFWWLPRALGVPQSKVAAALRVDPAVASRAAHRAAQRARDDARVRWWMERLLALVPGAESR